MIDSVQETKEDDESGIVFDQYTITTVEVQVIDQHPLLLRIRGMIDGVHVTILLDCGASTNVIRPGLASRVISKHQGQLKRFDGSLTSPAELSTVEATVRMSDIEFAHMIFTESPLDADQEVIFGLPWFRDYAPQVAWISDKILHQMAPANSDGMNEYRLAQPDQYNQGPVRSGRSRSLYVRRNEYAEIYMVKVSPVTTSEIIPAWVCNLILEYSVVFPEKLSDGLLPTRAVQFEVEMKPDAIPSSRTPFHLSKTEQAALESFVTENLKKGWVEVSNSPWVFNTFGIPKKDHVTGHTPTRGEWLRSGNCS